MHLRWTSEALFDVEHLRDFLAGAHGAAAAKVVKSLADVPAGLVANSRIGERLREFDPHEIRRLLMGRYKVRFEIADSVIYVIPARICDMSGIPTDPNTKLDYH